MLWRDMFFGNSDLCSLLLFLFAAVWAPFTFSKALTKFSKELQKKNLAQKRFFFIAACFFGKVIICD